MLVCAITNARRRVSAVDTVGTCVSESCALEQQTPSSSSCVRGRASYLLSLFVWLIVWLVSHSFALLAGQVRAARLAFAPVMIIRTHTHTQQAQMCPFVTLERLQPLNQDKIQILAD